MYTHPTTTDPKREQSKHHLAYMLVDANLKWLRSMKDGIQMLWVVYRVSSFISIRHWRVKEPRSMRCYKKAAVHTNHCLEMQMLG